MSEKSSIQSEPFSDEWIQEYISKVGMPPIAGAESVETSGGEGQGANEGDSEGESEGFWQSYLNDNVPEDYRPHVEPYLRDVERNANQKISEAAEYRKQWEPYENLNLSEYDPEGLEKLLQFAEQMNDPDAFKEWWNNVGQETGYLDELLANDDDDDDLDDEGQGIDLDALSERFGELLDERLAPLEQREQNRSQQQQLQEANETMDNRLEELSGGQLDEKAEQAVWRFAYAHADEFDDPKQIVDAAWKDYQEFVADVENGTVQRKINLPGPPESGGGPANTNGEAVTDWKDAKEVARNRLAQANMG